MTDEYDPDAIDYEEDEGAQYREGYETSKELVVLLIDAQRNMFEPIAAEDAEEETYFDLAIKIAKDMMKSRIICSANDEMALVFYSTVHSQNQNKFDRVYVYFDLDVPDAQRIRALEDFNVKQFQHKVGSCEHGAAEESQGLAAEDLKYALWTSSQLFSGRSSRASKRILLFSNVEDPCGTSHVAGVYRDQIMARAKELHDAQVSLKFFPLISISQPFNIKVFWKEVLEVLRDEDEGALDVDTMSDITGQLDSLYLQARKRTYKKRPLANLEWRVTEDLILSVQMFALVMSTPRTAALQLEARTLEPLKVESAYICNDTGALLGDVTKKFFQVSGADKMRFPKVVMLQSELKEIKHVKAPGLRLLGFHPRSFLQDYYQVQQANFLYPNDQDRPGSRTLFIALHEAMRSMDRVAVCSLVRGNTGEPRLVALVAQEEVANAYGVQEEPWGMHMIYLPFADDLRAPEQDPSVMGQAVLQAEVHQVSRAEDMIHALTLNEFHTSSIMNPALQRHYEVIEKLALAEPIPDISTLEDGTLPDFEGMAIQSQYIHAFKEAVSVPDQHGTKAPAKGQKRARVPEGEPNIAAAVAQLDWKALAKSGRLEKLTVADLKMYLQFHRLALSGKKAELVARIQEHLEEGGGS